MQWIKTFHILFVMGWVTCLFALPRALLHWKHASEAGVVDTSTLRALCVRFFRFGCLMALLAMAFGLWLWLGYGFGGRWLQVKVGLVALLVLYYLISGWLVWRALRHRRFISGVLLRIFNEGPLILIVPIIYLVVAKP